MKISVITVCFNAEKTIEDTIKSILNQNYKNYEYIIVDGKSTDRTLEIIKKYENSFNGKLKVISESDKGIYDAMNKGISISSGDIIGFLNSDDVLINDNIFSDISENIKDYDFVYGNVLYCDYELKEVKRNYISGQNKGYDWCPAHPTLYAKKDVYDKVGNYNLNFNVSSDFDFMLRLNIGKYKYKYIDKYIVLMRIGGKSNGLKGYINGILETIKIYRYHNIKKSIIITLKRCIYVFKQIIFSKINNKKTNEILEDLRRG